MNIIAETACNARSFLTSSAGFAKIGRKQAKYGGMRMKIGIIGAMDVEVETLRSRMEGAKLETVSGMQFAQGRLAGCDAVVAVAGVGKVSAAMCAQTLILRYQPDVVINTGVAGGIGPDLKVLDVVLATAVVQHDMDTSPLGDPVGYISGLGCVEMPCDAALCAALADAAARAGIEVRRGLVASGDQFIASAEQIARIRAHFDAQAAEMEGGAIGQVCTANGVPFAVLRAISDGGNEEAKMSYPQFVQRASERSVRILMEYLQA